MFDEIRAFFVLRNIKKRSFSERHVFYKALRKELKEVVGAYVLDYPWELQFITPQMVLRASKQNGE